MVGCETNSGIGGYKTQDNWDATRTTQDYWVIKFRMDTATGVENIAEQTPVKIYPNPFSGDLNINVQNRIRSKLHL